MKYSETGFRGFYKQFVAVPVTERTKEALEGFPGCEDANYIVTYGYYDRQSGLNMEVLCGARFSNGKVQYAIGNDSISSTIRINDIEDDECYLIKDDGGLSKEHMKKIEKLSAYDASKDIENTRTMPFLDASRDRVFIDDVLVYLMRDGFKDEGCHVRITGLGEHCLEGEMLDEPRQNFGWHKGDTISFFVSENEDKSVICYTDTRP